MCGLIPQHFEGMCQELYFQCSQAEGKGFEKENIPVNDGRVWSRSLTGFSERRRDQKPNACVDLAFKCLIEVCLLHFVSGCYPFYQKDPFILEECPHVYFSGNAPTCQSKLIKGMKKLLSFMLPL